MNNIPDKIYLNNMLSIGKGIENIKIIENIITEEESALLYQECKNELFSYKDKNTGKQWKNKISSKDMISYKSNLILLNTCNKILKLAESLYNVKLEFSSSLQLVKWQETDNMEQHVDDFAVFHNNISSILYINDDYSGGEIVFKQYNYSIKPKSGSLVLFPGNKYYAHSVNKIISGNRYTSPFWFKYTGSDFHGRGRPLNFKSINDWIEKDWEHGN